MFDELPSFEWCVVCDGGGSGTTVHAGGVAGEYVGAEGAVACGGVWVAVGSACPVVPGCAPWALAGAVVECWASWCGADAHGCHLVRGCGGVAGVVLGRWCRGGYRVGVACRGLWVGG